MAQSPYGPYGQQYLDAVKNQPPMYNDMPNIARQQQSYFGATKNMNDAYGQLTGYQSQLTGMIQHDPGTALYQKLLGLYSGDPGADLNQQLLAQYKPVKQQSRGYTMIGY